MLNVVIWLIYISLLCSIAGTPRSFAGTLSRKPADVVFRNAAVYTMDATRPWTEAVAISGGRIGYAGSDSGIQAWIGPKTTVIDLHGKMMLPRFYDSP
jgi:predicted amidohydrolase YtcJ